MNTKLAFTIAGHQVPWPWARDDGGGPGDKNYLRGRLSSLAVQRAGALALRTRNMPALHRTLPRMASTLLILTLAYNFAQLTWALWPWSDTDMILAAGPARGGYPAEPARSMQPSIGSLHLFGIPQANALGTQALTSIPESSLNLTLRGVIASRNQAHARAIIADSGGKENSYALGATLPGGAALKEIYADHIVLARNGLLETLWLNPNHLANISAPAGSKRGFVAPAGADIKTQLAAYRNVLKTDPMSLAGLIQATPVSQGGSIVGYRIQPGSDTRLFSHFGFQPGDVVIAINGTSLASLGNGLEIIRSVTTSTDNINVVIQRSGQQQSLNVNLGQP